MGRQAWSNRGIIEETLSISINDLKYKNYLKRGTKVGWFNTLKNGEKVGDEVKFT